MNGERERERGYIIFGCGKQSPTKLTAFIFAWLEPRVNEMRKRENVRETKRDRPKWMKKWAAKTMHGRNVWPQTKSIKIKASKMG